MKISPMLRNVVWTAIALNFTAVALVACNKRAEKTSQPNAVFQVDTLFTQDGCTVYRFHDEGRAHYFTNCSGTTLQYQSCGKNCTYLDGVTGGAK